MSWTSPKIPWLQATDCRTSQMSTLWLVCRKPVSIEEGFWWSSLHCIIEGWTVINLVCFFFLSGLRKDYVSSASQKGCEPPVPSYFNTSAEKTDDVTAGYRSGALSSSCWQPCQSPTSPAKQGIQTSKLSRLHQQVTQFKLLKLAQNQGT